MTSLGSLFRTKTQQDKLAAASSSSSPSAYTRTNSAHTRTTISTRTNSAYTRTNSGVEIKANGHTIYLIRHGEKPPKLDNGDDAIGLSPDGKRRAVGLVDVFGKRSKYDIGCIFAQKYKPSGKRRRAYDTVTPLARDLGLTINATIDRDDIKGIAAAAKAWNGPGNVIICWENKAMNKIMEKLGVEGKFKYPKKRFDVIWTVKFPYKQLHSWKSEGIQTLDEHHQDPK